MIRILSIMFLTAVLGLPAGLAPVTESGYAKMVAGHKGKVVLVNFWATYCVPCRKEMPALVQMQERLKAKGLVLITVSADEPEDEAKAIEFLNKTRVPEPRYLRKAANEDAFINAVEPKWSGALPASILYDKTGRKVRSFVGEVDLKVLEAAILKLF